MRVTIIAQMIIMETIHVKQRENASRRSRSSKVGKFGKLMDVYNTPMMVEYGSVKPRNTRNQRPFFAAMTRIIVTQN